MITIAMGRRLASSTTSPRRPLSRCSTPPSPPPSWSLRVAHPAIDDVPFDPEHDIAPPLLTAHLIVSRSAELRVLLDLYRAALRRCVNFDHDDDDEISAGPF